MISPDQIILDVSSLTPSERAEFVREVEQLHQRFLTIWSKFIPKEVIESNRGVSQHVHQVSEEEFFDFYEAWTDGELEDAQQVNIYLFNEVMARYMTFKTLQKNNLPQMIDEKTLELVKYVDQTIKKIGEKLFRFHFGSKVSQSEQFQILAFFTPEKVRNILPEMYLNEVENDQNLSGNDVMGFAVGESKVIALKTRLRNKEDATSTEQRKDRIKRDTKITHEIVHLYQNEKINRRLRLLSFYEL